MAPRGRSFRSPRTGNSARRRVSWSIGPSGSINITASVAALFPVAAQALLDDLTLVRTRAELLVFLTLAGGASGEGFRWAFGMANVSENAAGIGATAVPSPITDIAWDGWFVHQQGQIVQVAAEGAAQFEGPHNQRVSIDSKAMRKTHATDVIVGAFETTELGAGAEMTAMLETRLLDKLA